MKNIKAIFYDLDGTLRFNNPSGRDLFMDEAARLGIVTTPDDRLRATRWEHYYFATSPEIREDIELFPESKDFWVNYSRRLLQTLGATDEQAGRLAPVLHAYMQEHHDRNIGDTLMPGICETLQVLKQTGIILAVVSNREEPYGDYLEQLGLAAYFNFSVAAGDVKSWKPDPVIFEHALKLAGVQAVETIYVGDNYYADVVGARNAGLHPILIDEQGIFEEPGCPVVCSHHELLALLQKSDIWVDC